MAGLGDAFRTAGGMKGWERCGDNTGATSGHPPKTQGVVLKLNLPSHLPRIWPYTARGRLNCLTDKNKPR